MMNWKREQAKIKAEPAEYQEGFAAYIAGAHQGMNPYNPFADGNVTRAKPLGGWMVYGSHHCRQRKEQIAVDMIEFIA